jgi:hypothetical protein
MRYSEEQVNDIFDSICERIECGEAVRNILKGEDMPSSRTFFKWLEEDEYKVKQYARAKDIYAEAMFEDIILISDGTDDDVLTDEDGVKQVNYNVIQRDRLRTDNRKWALSKLNPKKYGDKIDMTSGGKKIETTQIIGMVVKDEPNTDD